MVKKVYYLIIATLVSLIGTCTLFSQETTVYDEMSLDELCEVDVVVTASKKPEDLFDAPLSVTIVKKDEIIKAGCRNIMEALRLSPGLIVRETTPGNFDIHIRGFDDVNKNFYMPLPFNSTILVMIDYRVVFSYFSGGTLWETLPIGIQDIERIEVVRGPASALYGPNAVNGVINIITSQAKEPGLNTYVHAGLGTQKTEIVNASVGYNWSDKTKINFSANFSERNRFDRNYYSWNDKNYVNWRDLSMIMDVMKDTITRELYTARDFMDTLNTDFNEKLSYQSAGANAFFSHITCNSRYDVSLGINHSESQKPGPMNFLTPFSQFRSNSIYFDSHISIFNWTGQFNVITGENINNFAFNSHKYTVLNATLEYNWQIFKSLNFRPGLNVRQIQYYSPIINDQPFDFAKMNYSFTDEKRKVTNRAFYFLTEWKPTSNLRFIGGLRADTFNLDKTGTINYELAATYRLNKNNLFRIVNTEASRAPFIFDTYLNSKNEFDGKFNGSNYPVKEFYSTQQQLKYPTNNTLEIGWRSKVGSDLSFEIELFTSKLKNILVSINYLSIDQKFLLNSKNQPTTPISFDVKNVMRAENYNMSARQNGATFNLNYKALNNLSFGLFTTFQQTKILGSDSIFRSSESFNVDSVNRVGEYQRNEIFNITNMKSEATPSVFGGLIVNFQPGEKWNINLNNYFYSRQTFSYTYDKDSNFTLLEIDPWINMNLKISYQPMTKLNIYVSGYNLLGKHREYWGADNIGTSLMLGLQWGY